MKKTISIAFLLLLTSHSFATCLIVIYTRHGIYFAADSREIIYKDGIKSISNNSVKIGHVKDYFFMTSGLVYERRTRFDANKSIAAHLMTIRKFHLDSLNKFKSKIKAEFKKTLEFASKSSDYKKIPPGQIYLAIVIGGISDGIPFVYSYNLTFDSLQNPLKIKTAEQYKTTLSEPGYFFAGVKNNIRNFLISDTTFDPNNSDREYVRKRLLYLQGLAMKEDSLLVGGAVDILRLSPQGPDWIQKKQNTPTEY